MKKPIRSNETITSIKEQGRFRITNQRIKKFAAQYKGAEKGPKIEVSHGILGVLYTVMRAI